MNIYYVYMYLREDGTPYYVGKGKNRRAYQKHCSIPVPSDKSRVVFPYTNLTEQEALIREVELISYYGRKNNSTGILRNLTDGGEGVSGYKHTDKTKQIISERMTSNHPRGMLNKTHSDHLKSKWSTERSGENNPNWGNTQPDHVRAAVSTANTNMVSAIDLVSGNTVKIPKSVFDANRGTLYIGVRSGAPSNKPKGVVAVVDLITMTRLTISQDEFYSNRDRYVGVASKRAKELLGQT